MGEAVTGSQVALADYGCEARLVPRRAPAFWPNPPSHRMPPAMRTLLDRTQTLLLLLADLVHVTRVPAAQLLPLLRAAAVSLTGGLVAGVAVCACAVL